MLQVAVLASGSNGNSIYVESARVGLLIDAGISTRRIQQRLEHIGRHPKDVAAVLLTHEHSDHVRGVPVLARRFGTPIYMNAGTRRAARRIADTLGSVETIHTGRSFAIEDIVVHTTPVLHDAAEPIAFVLESGGIRFGVLTDLGTASPEVIRCLPTLDGLLIETNHDPYLLEVGPYPPELKVRIASRYGHLSNEQARDLIVDHGSERLRVVFLGHLSEENNTALKALDCVNTGLRRSPRSRAPRTVLTSRFATTPLMRLTPEEEPVPAARSEAGSLTERIPVLQGLTSAG